MRRAAALLLLLLLAFSVAAVVVAAEDITDILPAGGNNGSAVEDPGLGKTGQNGETNPDAERKAHEEGGLDSAVAGNNNTDTSVEGASAGSDDPVQKPSDRDENTTATASSTDFSQDPLVSGCDPSHRCLIGKHKFIACLKVSGDSSALSLLMDNKGVHPLDVSITAPDYVTIAEYTVHVEANGHNETQVSVSVSDTMNDMAIVLKVAEETCRINLDTAVTRNRGRAIPMRLTSTYMLVPAFVLLGLVGLCVKLRKSSKPDGAPAYQKLDAPELPVSIGGKKEADHADKWDDNWGDDWDDEEAPSTPSNSMPNLSSKGLASRKSTKDGWKD
ncbi:uncharacterized protein [Lolium perenne]|uniref:uncharacterized protein n=1 Tax=Lolium perenne TaxID=4522 RepID=UPI0021F60647|nr:uncharacterized protein LOC127327729 [Lolium perenne]